MKKETMIKGYGLVILSAFLFGCMPLITRYIYAAGINRESVVLLRNLLALPVLGILAWHQSKSFQIPVKALPAIVAIALMGCCVTPLLLYGSYQRIATGTATVFHFVYPAVVVLIGLVFLRKKLNAGTIFAVVLCVGGICLFYDPNESLDWGGCALALASGITYAIYVVLLSVFRHKEVSGFQLSFYISVICSIAMLAVCLITDRLTLPGTAGGWLLAILLAVLINVGAVVMFQRGTLLIGGERASVLSTVEPLTGVLMGLIFFQEKVNLGMGIGTVLVILACVMITVFDRKHSAS
jgi:drug/metabolite transporter (DMT)-like permease